MNCVTCNCNCQRFGKHRNGFARFRCPRCGKTYTEQHTRLFDPMIIPEEKALLAIQLLLEGSSVRTTERVTGLHRDTILKLLVVAGERCMKLMDEKMRGLHCERIQGDELWCFVGKKQRNVRAEDSPELGDAWVFVALDADSKLIPAYTVGKRTRETTYNFLNSLKSRIAEEHRFQLTTDGFHFYRKGVEDVFAGQADFAQLIKIFGDHGQQEAAGRYSPAAMTQTIIKIRDGRPTRRHISTSYVERSNLSIRMALRRFTRLTNAYSKKLDNLKAACALYFAYYNFCRVHSSIRVSPAVEAGITDRIWTLRELLS
jgi:IS1 family transposase/transposase-like protein